MVKAKGSIKYLSCAITAAVLWGFFAFPLRRIQSYSPQQILYYRVFVSFTVVWGVNLLFRRSKLRQDYQQLSTLPKSTRNKLIGLIVGAGICITGNWFSFIYVINHISLKAAAFAYMVCPIITAAGGFILLKEPLKNCSHFYCHFECCHSLHYVNPASYVVSYCSINVCFIFNYAACFK